MSKDYILSWKAAGIALGLLLTLATALTQPLGVSTEFVTTDAMLAHKLAPQFAEENAYLAKYGEKINWSIDYGWMLVFGMLVGGGAMAMVFRDRQPKQDQGSMPDMWRNQFGSSRAKRNAVAFLGGVLLLFGARLAGGCTSGHMISGISQLALSSFLFGLTGFGAGIVTAKTLYRAR